MSRAPQRAEVQAGEALQKAVPELEVLGVHLGVRREVVRVGEDLLGRREEDVGAALDDEVDEDRPLLGGRRAHPLDEPGRRRGDAAVPGRRAPRVVHPGEPPVVPDLVGQVALGDRDGPGVRLEDDPGAQDLLERVRPDLERAEHPPLRVVPEGALGPDELHQGLPANSRAWTSFSSTRRSTRGHGAIRGRLVRAVLPPERRAQTRRVPPRLAFVELLEMDGYRGEPVRRAAHEPCSPPGETITTSPARTLLGESPMTSPEPSVTTIMPLPRSPRGLSG